ncbi:MAG: hypothetical protein GY798_09365 [Hyphomicrobiales bacterium]|nr:hypothetical protein [Hyphomicrobiales bacterium]
MSCLAETTSPLTTGGGSGARVIVKGIVSLEDGKRTTYEDISALQPFVRSGGLDDLVCGEVSIKVGKKSKVDDIAGLLIWGNGDPRIETEGGSDTVTGLVSVRAGKKSKVTDISGIYEVSDAPLETRDPGIKTGNDADTVTGMVTIKGKNLKAAYGDGIRNAVIDTGAGDDTVKAVGAKKAIAKSSADPSRQTSEGLDSAKLILGSGEDYVLARRFSRNQECVHLCRRKR